MTTTHLLIVIVGLLFFMAASFGIGVFLGRLQERNKNINDHYKDFTGL